MEGRKVEGQSLLMIQSRVCFAEKPALCVGGLGLWPLARSSRGRNTDVRSAFDESVLKHQPRKHASAAERHCPRCCGEASALCGSLSGSSPAWPRAKQPFLFVSERDFLFSSLFPVCAGPSQVRQPGRRTLAVHMQHRVPEPWTADSRWVPIYSPVGQVTGVPHKAPQLQFRVSQLWLFVQYEILRS